MMSVVFYCIHLCICLSYARDKRSLRQRGRSLVPGSTAGAREQRQGTRRAGPRHVILRSSASVGLDIFFQSRSTKAGGSSKERDFLLAAKRGDFKVIYWRSHAHICVNTCIQHCTRTARQALKALESFVNIECRGNDRVTCAVSRVFTSLLSSLMCFLRSVRTLL